MSLDERGRQAAASLRERLDDRLDPESMLASLPRTRARRRMAIVAPVAVLAVVTAALVTDAHGRLATAPTVPVPTAPTQAPAHANGPIFGAGENYIRHPRGTYAPALRDGSSPTWSPDGTEVAVLAGGIEIRGASTGTTSRLPCQGCQEIAWSPDGRTFAAVGAAGRPLGLVDAVTGRVTPVPLARVTGIRSVSWDRASRRLAFLVTSPQSVQGAYTVDRDGGHLQRIVVAPTDLDADAGGHAVLLVARWGTTSDRIAVLAADPTPGRNGAPYGLLVQDYRPDGSGAHLLIRAGSCGCRDFQPNVVWSPDGTALALFAGQGRHIVRASDGDGRPVMVWFVRGSGPLSWQPLPNLG